ncbi:DUF6498-containing protein [Brevundimonas sp.]|uniref:DUF6498-containing protein n=1 Tax=Brevundimonas sp. TaxID=1871086 RepID=UPI001D984983|nr:DUF6498-containing protein [Brevundimonas sp.]MBA4000945.1 hypothetical protein [Brevundimonas sp.]
MADTVITDMGRRLGGARLLLIILLNLIPVAGVLWLGWDAGQILMLYWVENIIVGVLSLVRILTARQPDTLAPGSAQMGTIGVGCFFIVHYGLFTLVHGVFTMILASRIIDDEDGLWGRVFTNPTFYWAVLAAAALQIVIVIREWWSSGLWRRSSPGVEMVRPYGRIVVLHVTVLAAAWWLSETSAPMAAVLILCLMKAVVELVMTALVSPADRAPRRP